MNRMTPLIVRRAGSRAAALRIDQTQAFPETEAAAWLQDLRLFATGWVGGLVFFGTLFG